MHENNENNDNLNHISDVLHFQRQVRCVDTDIADAATENNLPVIFMGTHELFEGTRLYQGNGCDWVLSNLSGDPLYYSNGNRLLVPREVIEYLKRVYDAGMTFESMYIAHEVPRGSVKDPEKVPLELIVPPPPPQYAKQVQKIDGTIEAFWKIIGKTAMKAGAAITQQTRQSILAAGDTSRNLLQGYAHRDPVMFGVKIHGPYQPRWYFLTHWAWPMRAVT